jgi:methionyl-tRNA synthetase
MRADKPFFLTTAIDYVNNLPHLGTAYEKICADVLARFKRLEGVPVFFLMGNDEHSINVKKVALARGLTPQAYCDQMAVQFQEIWRKLGISYDAFIRTTDERHVRGVTALFRRIHEKGDIYLSKYRGLYCDSCETFYREKDLADGKCPHHGTEPRWIEEENYFFALSRYGDRVRELIEEERLLVLPEVRRNEVLNIIHGGLEDISISRSSFDWGIPLPLQPDHVVYVWFDALINYISAIGYGWDEERFSRTWPADLHIIGKDITRFHCIIWPAMLLSAGIEPPRLVFGHGFVYLKGEKMSKTLGNVVTPMELIDIFGPDALRYYLLRDTSFGKDGNFTWDNFQERYNRDLANDLGNLLQRVLTIIQRYRDGVIPAPQGEREEDTQLKASCLGLYREISVFLDPSRGDIDFHLALTRIWETVRLANQYVDRTAAWDLHKRGETARLDTVIYFAVECLRFLGTILSPFLPHTAGKLLRQLGFQDAPETLRREALTEWGRSPAGSRVSRPEPMFPRIEEKKEKTMTEAPAPPPAGTDSREGKTVSFDTFQSLDLRVGRILSAERVPKTDKLLKLTVDVGEVRTLVAGIGQFYEPERLPGLHVAVVVNLEPARIRGILSEGMILAAGSEGHLALVTFTDPVKPGDKIR